MRHSRMAIVAVSGLSVLLLAGCGGGGAGRDTGQTSSDSMSAAQAPGDTAPVGLRAPSDTTLAAGKCEKPSEGKITRPLGFIAVQDTPIVHPDPMVQTRVGGALLWAMAPGQAADRFRITFTAGSPLPRDVYEGVPPDVVGGVVDPHADCRVFKYKVEVWQDGNAEPVTSDPQAEVVPG